MTTHPTVEIMHPPAFPDQVDIRIVGANGSTLLRGIPAEWLPALGRAIAAMAPSPAPAPPSDVDAALFAKCELAIAGVPGETVEDRRGRMVAAAADLIEAQAARLRTAALTIEIAEAIVAEHATRIATLESALDEAIGIVDDCAAMPVDITRLRAIRSGAA